MEKFKVLTATLAGGVNQHEFTDLIINNDSVIEVYTTDDNIYPTDIYQQGNTVYVTLVDHSDIIGVCVTVNNVTSFSQPMYAADIIYNLINPEYTVYDAISSVEDEIRHIPDYYVGFDRYDEDQETINNKFDTLDEDLVGLTTAVNNIADDVSDIQGDISGIQGEVTSVKESFTQLDKEMSQYEKQGYLSKNLLSDRIASTTVAGISLTSNEDGTYTLNGTAVGNAIFYISRNCGLVKNNNYRLVGCPKGGSNEKYRLVCTNNTNQGFDDFGDGKTFKPTTDYTYLLLIVVAQGTSVSNLVFKPMLVNADTYPNITYDDYTEHIPSNAELKKSFTSLITAEEPTIEITSNVKSGSISCVKMGRLTIIRFWAVQFTQANSSINATGRLPSVSGDNRREATVLRGITANTALAWIDGSGVIQVNADSTNASYYGELIYIAD